jgi:hypothetical protein
MKLLAAMVLFVTTSVFAVEVKVAETSIDTFRPQASASFGVNRDMGRAWIDFEHSDSTGGYGDGGTTPSWERMKVEGLVYDQTTSKIMFTHEGQVFECANVYKKWYGVIVKPSGCSLKVRDARVTVDDGYRTYKTWVHQVFIVTK